MCWSNRTAGITMPFVCLQAVEDTGGQGDGFPAVLAGDARSRAGLHATDKMLQLAGQGITACVAILVHRFKISAEEVVLEHHQGCGVQFALAQSVATQLLSGLNETDVPLGEIKRDEALRRPNVHAPL